MKFIEVVRYYTEKRTFWAVGFYCWFWLMWIEIFTHHPPSHVFIHAALAGFTFHRWRSTPK